MFDRCDPDTTSIIDEGLAEARRLGHNWLGTEHVLIALLQHPALLPPAVVMLLPSVDAVRSALNAAISGPPPADAELLATLGIDLQEVRTTIGRTFGTDALDRLGRRRVHQPWQPWRRPSRRCISILAGNMSCAPRLKQALEHALRDATQRDRALIEPAGLLLGIVTVQDAVANELLRTLGVDPDHIRSSLQQATR